MPRSVLSHVVNQPFLSRLLPGQHVEAIREFTGRPSSAMEGEDDDFAEGGC